MGNLYKTVLEHMYKNRDFTDMLVKNNKIYLISKIFDKAILERTAGKIDESHVCFLSGGLFNLYQHWAEDGYKELPEDIAKRFSVSVLNI